MPSLAMLTRVVDVLLEIRRDLSPFDDEGLLASVDLTLLLIGRRLAAQVDPDVGFARTKEAPAVPREPFPLRLGPVAPARRLRR